MIVTLRAAHGGPQKSFTRDVHDIADHVTVCLITICWFIVALHQGHESSSYFGSNITVWEFITCELFCNKTVIGLIVVKSLNNIISVAPNVRLFAVSLKAIGFCVANCVQPKTC